LLKLTSSAIGDKACGEGNGFSVAYELIDMAVRITPPINIFIFMNPPRYNDAFATFMNESTAYTVKRLCPKQQAVR
jgi:hypothetical protein